VVRNLFVSVIKDFNVEKKFVHKIVGRLVNDLGIEIKDIRINFINSNSIMKINREYLKHNYSTDIITFDYSGVANKLEAEIYISVNDAESNAKRYRVSLKEEIIRLVIHGFLHLCGYDDRSESKRLKMRKVENRLLNKYKTELNLGMLR